MRLLVVSLFVLFSTSVHAIPVEWVLQDIEFDDGGKASGSFTYDADTNSYSNINITTTGGSSFAGATYTTVSTYLGGGAANYLFVTESTNGTEDGFGHLRLIFGSDLTNTSGPTSLVNNWFVPTMEATCASSCDTHEGDLRSMVEGEASQQFGFVVQASALVPVPPAVYLFGSALLLLARRKREQTS